MDKRCLNCGHMLSEGDTICKNCNTIIENNDMASNTAIGRLFSRRKMKKNHKYINKLLNKIILILALVCLIAVAVFFIMVKNSKGVVKGLEILLPKNQSSAYVLYQMNNISELQALKLNKADYYLYHDREGRSAGLIVRYYISVNFKLDEGSITRAENGSFIINFKRPTINANLLDGIDYTEKKEPETYPGVEIFSISNSWVLGPDFQMGELREIAQNYIEDKSYENIDNYTKEAFENLKQKILSISNELKLNISEIKLEGVDL